MAPDSASPSPVACQPSVAVSSRLAGRLRAAIWNESIGSALLLAREQGMSFFAPPDSPNLALFAKQSATARPCLMGLFFGRPEAKQTEAFVEAKLARSLDELNPPPEASPQGAKRPGDSRRRPLNHSPIRLRIAPPGLPEAWRRLAAAQINARRSWAISAQRLLATFRVEDLLAGGVGWESLLLAPPAILFPWLSQAGAAGSWADAVGHTPLSALALMDGGGLAAGERSAIIQKLVALRSPALSDRVANPMFSIYLRAQISDVLDQELSDAAQAVGCSPDTLGSGGLSAIDLVSACAVFASVHRAPDFQKTLARLEALALSAAATPSRGGETSADATTEPRRAARRI